MDFDNFFQPRGERIKLKVVSNALLWKTIFLLILIIIIVYFFYLQFFLKKTFADIEESITSLIYLSFAPRGEIYDNSGKVLATFKKVFDFYIDVAKVNKNIDLSELFAAGRVFYRGNQIIVRNVNPEIALKFFNKDKAIQPVPSFQRDYKVNEEFGNLIGYIGFVDEDNDQYYKEEFIGKTGLELYYDRYLHGSAGRIVYKKDKDQLKKVEESLPSIGSSLYLTVDSSFQKKAYQLIDSYMKENNYKKAAFVAFDPNSGEIIALISYPSYDPLVFINDPQKTATILNNSEQPLFNRVISGLYSPGSTIKLIVAAAALEEKIVTPETKIFANGLLRIKNPYIPGSYSIFKDNKVHGWTDIYKAIANSVNIYFYVVGGGYPDDDEQIPIKSGLGIYRLIEYWKKYNLGEKSGIDFPNEKAGLLPSPEWKARHLFDKQWRLGDTYNVSIGQGDLLVTPLQIALWTGAMATNKIYKPFLVKKIIDNSGRIIFERQKEIIRDNIINENNLKIIQQGMRMTVTNGTAKTLNDLPVAIAGKSGTPEILGKQKLNAIFTGYFPYGKPAVVMTLLIEEVPLGSVATLPLYKELVKAYLDLKK
ncbi:MAG: penicillin-binding protein 2 [Candidatus Parcubacteria bacterium]|nr:MAG: penicillin-binding protein 2 [Candidatus Parcubacteria bacterium]